MSDVNAKAALWYPPDTPHADDDEFDAGSSLSNWDIEPSASASAINPYANFTGNPRVDLNASRRSWLRFQATATGVAGNPDGLARVSKPVTVPTNLLAWARLSATYRVNGTANNELRAAISLSATKSGSSVDGDNIANCYLFESDNDDVRAEAEVYEGGAFTQADQSNNTFARGSALSFVAVHKVGTTIYFWVGTVKGSWIHIGTHTGYSGASFDRFSFGFSTVTGNAPGNIIYAADFARFQETANFLL